MVFKRNLVRNIFVIVAIMLIVSAVSSAFPLTFDYKYRKR